jgi:hypothetical protein
MLLIWPLPFVADGRLRVIKSTPALCISVVLGRIERAGGRLWLGHPLLWVKP